MLKTSSKSVLFTTHPLAPSKPRKSRALATVPVTITDSPDTREFLKRLIAGDQAARDAAIAVFEGMAPSLLEAVINSAKKHRAL